MPVSLHSVSAPIFVQILTGLSDVLGKAQAQAEAKKLDTSFLLSDRLYPDMFSLTRQVRQATNHAVNAVGQCAGVAPPKFADDETTIPQLRERIAKSIEFVKSIKASQVDGQENKDITMTFPSGERKFKGQGFVLNFCMPNFYFHCTTAYDILRKNGIELGKRDFMSTPVQM